jgi:hypothetical protein
MNGIEEIAEIMNNNKEITSVSVNLDYDGVTASIYLSNDKPKAPPPLPADAVCGRRETYDNHGL